MFYDRLAFWRKKKQPKYPNLGATMKSAEDIAKELNLARDKQMEAMRQKRADIEIVYKSRYEALMWVLGKDATTIIR